MAAATPVAPVGVVQQAISAVGNAIEKVTGSDLNGDGTIGGEVPAWQEHEIATNLEPKLRKCVTETLSWIQPYEAKATARIMAGVYESLATEYSDKNKDLAENASNKTFDLYRSAIMEYVDELKTCKDPIEGYRNCGRAILKTGGLMIWAAMDACNDFAKPTPPNCCHADSPCCGKRNINFCVEQAIKELDEDLKKRWKKELPTLLIPEHVLSKLLLFDFKITDPLPKPFNPIKDNPSQQVMK
eukprot:CAMPEP_0180751914 /NCGR_PEP_ID=MMETSP1038_2-20121128/31876_1 /TAXON_ID=632150 /ORGANISM="Azadinium spinosum, Strain 3D9" /LENGTH=242 /DNA_ID=CAMNT_0022785711 /DNA_START=60 /DNA_END=788 /DNA_ORIENTATION=+